MQFQVVSKRSISFFQNKGTRNNSRKTQREGENRREGGGGGGVANGTHDFFSSLSPWKKKNRCMSSSKKKSFFSQEKNIRFFFSRSSLCLPAVWASHSMGGLNDCVAFDTFQDRLLFKLIEIHGTRWSLIQSDFDFEVGLQRSVSSLRNRWQRILRGQVAASGVLKRRANKCRLCGRTKFGHSCLVMKSNSGKRTRLSVEEELDLPGNLRDKDAHKALMNYVEKADDLALAASQCTDLSHLEPGLFSADDESCPYLGCKEWAPCVDLVDRQPFSAFCDHRDARIDPKQAPQQLLSLMRVNVMHADTRFTTDIDAHIEGFF